MKELMDIYRQIKKMYESKYDIHICRIDELDELLDFINDYWQKDHILTQSKELLDWQHFDKKNGRYNFVIAKHRQTNEIHGIIGFIISNIYDENIDTPIRWGAIWKLRDDVSAKGLGLMLKGFLEEEIPVKYIGGVGLSKYSKAIDTKLGESMGTLQQYYIANPHYLDYKLILNPDIISVNYSETKVMKEIFAEEFGEVAKTIIDKIMPYKSIDYYINRYYNHPIYSYRCFLIEDNENSCLLFCRTCSAEGRSAIFLVDYIGDGSELSGTNKLFLELLDQENAEYICFPCYGIDETYLHDAGFVLRDAEKTILPIYYEPFCRKNVELDFHFYSELSGEHIIIVKGDADQDRPSRL